jgi:hypothetical protein
MSDEFKHDRDSDGGAAPLQRGLREPARGFETDGWGGARERGVSRDRRMVGWWILPSFVLGLGFWAAVIAWLLG